MSARALLYVRPLVPNPGIVTDVIGFALVGLVVIIQILEKRHDKKMANT